MKPDTKNTIFQLALAFVTHTNRHVFVTGKAGTGKTTFLKYIRDLGYRKMAIVAPTGVAAINAGGVTIHSFFQIPPSTFIPGNETHWGMQDSGLNNAATLIRGLKMNAEKMQVIREIELLVIDEVSMVRADLLDAIDAVLRHLRDQPSKPFGGVQMVFIGDLFQLPPVVRNQEWDVLKKYYASPFFFDAHALKKSPPLTIELTKIYRQKDDAFIKLLNNVRNNQCSDHDLKMLHQYFKPDFTPPKGEHYITLSSHNEKADKINQRELEKLPGRVHRFEATIEGAFFEQAFPAEKTLVLKEGAQVMFIKNDSGENRRYYNGKIGTISSISGEQINIRFPGENDVLELEEETWENIRYNYNKETEEVDQEKQGSFRQFPIRLAWAITIHKSQGLTFDRAVIDAGSSFAAGQVYVSLSRLTGLKGLVLHSRIEAGCIHTDQRVISFSREQPGEEFLKDLLQKEERNFIRKSLIEYFDLRRLGLAAQIHDESYEYRQFEQKEEAVKWSAALRKSVNAEVEVAKKFKMQLERLLPESGDNVDPLFYQRINAGAEYFTGQIEKLMIAQVVEQLESIKGRKKIKTYAMSLEDLASAFKRKVHRISQALELARALKEGMPLDKLQELLKAQRKPVAIKTIYPNPKQKKGKRGFRKIKPEVV